MSRLLALCGALLWAASVAAAQGGPAANRTNLIEHGKYLTTRVAGCADCHSPHNQRGEVIAGRELQGAALDFQPTHPVPGWASVAPPIAGLAGWTESEAIRFFTTGLNRSNKPPAPPMPAFRLSRHDAEAVVAYLKSLPPPK